MIVNTITEAKAQLSALVERAQEGEEIIIQKAGKPVAVLRKYESHKTPRQPGAFRGRVEIASDFDELPADLAAELGMDQAE